MKLAAFATNDLMRIATEARAKSVVLVNASLQHNRDTLLQMLTHSDAAFGWLCTTENRRWVDEKNGLKTSVPICSISASLSLIAIVLLLLGVHQRTTISMLNLAVATIASCGLLSSLLVLARFRRHMHATVTRGYCEIAEVILQNNGHSVLAIGNSGISIANASAVGAPHHPSVAYHSYGDLAPPSTVEVASFFILQVTSSKGTPIRSMAFPLTSKADVLSATQLINERLNEINKRRSPVY